MRLWSSITRWFYRHFARFHRKRWDEMDLALTRGTRLRLMLFLSRQSPTTNRDIVDYLMETGQFTSRESAVRVADRHLAQMAKAGSVQILKDQKILMKKPRPLIILKPPGVWISFGLGAGIVFFGLGFLRGDMYLTGAAAALITYSVAVIAYLLLRGAPY